MQAAIHSSRVAGTSFSRSFLPPFCWSLQCHSLMSSAASQPGISSPKLEQAQSQSDLIDRLVKAGLLTPRAATAMRAVDRSFFAQAYPGVPGHIAYQDTTLPISCGQTMPAPSVHAKFLSLLEPFIRPGAAVLDLGAGTGYMAACLAQLTGPTGCVLALEKQAKLVERARESIKASSPELVDIVSFGVCNVMAGPEELQGSERFDAIHCGASVQEVPQQFLQLLKPGGRLVLPLGAMHGAAPQVLTTVDKAAGSIALSRQQHGGLTTRIAPLTLTQDDDIWSSEKSL